MKHLRICLLLPLLLSFFAVVARAQHVSVSAADYTPNVAPGSLASAFGTDLAAATEAAASLPLPTKLAGTRVLVNGEAAALLFVSPGQINYRLPEGTRPGDAEVVVERDGAARSRETLRVKGAAFAAFTSDQTGAGAGAILNGRNFKAGPFRVVEENGDATILALFGTGLGEAGSRSFVSGRVRVYVGGVEARVHYAGPQPQYAGLDQINFELPASVAEHGALPVVVKIDDAASNSVTTEVTATETASVAFAVSESFTEANDIAALGVSPLADVDSLKVTVRSINLVTDKGVEVAVVSSPLTVDLLRPDSAARLVAVAKLMAGTYAELSAELADVAASYKGQAVAIKLAAKGVKQKLAAPLKLDKDAQLTLRFGFDLRASAKRQADGSYVFDPVMTLLRPAPTLPPAPIQNFVGKIAAVDAEKKLLKVTKGEGSNASSVAVDATKAVIVGADGKPANFDAFKVDQKVEVSGLLNAQGVVEARLIYIGGRPQPPRPIVATGTVNSVDTAAQTFELKVESLVGVQTLVPVTKMTIKWNAQTKFADDLRGQATADSLRVGRRVVVRLLDFANVSTAAEVVITHPRIAGTVSNTAGLPQKFVVSVPSGVVILPVPGPPVPTQPVTVVLTPTTVIKSLYGEALKPEDLAVGSQVSVVGDLTAPNELTAAYVIVIGGEARGVTNPAEVDAAAKVFALTREDGSKVKVRLTEQTVIFVAGANTLGARPVVKPDEFLRLLAGKAYTAHVFGLLDSGGLLRAVTVRAEEKK